MFDHIALDADLQGRGLGSILFEYAKWFVETMGRVAFCFNTITASRFYKKLGAKPAVEYKDFVKKCDGTSGSYCEYAVFSKCVMQPVQQKLDCGDGLVIPFEVLGNTFNYD